jgi:exosortase A-associated hydrolase 2
VYYHPDAEPTTGAVLLPPMFEERRSAQRAMAEFCSGLADRGVGVLHPDLCGCGNSGGPLSEASLEAWRDDLDAAFAFLRERSGAGAVHLVGCRLGALLAAWYLDEEPTAAERLLLWNPVASGNSYLSAARKRRLIQDSLTDAGERPTVDPTEVEGQLLSEALFDELAKLDLTKLAKPADARVFQCSFNDKLTLDVQKLLKAWGEDGIPVECVVAQPFWNAHTPAGYDELVNAAAELLLREPH